MRVLVLSPYAHRLRPVLMAAGDEVTETNDHLWTAEYDYVVSYGYRHIIREPQLSLYAGRMVNIHIGFLPWNRGAHPNFWSWFDDTPKGITIHDVDAGIDTGTIRLRIFVPLLESGTLASTYKQLHDDVPRLFELFWLHHQHRTVVDRPLGSSHRAADFEPWWPKLRLGWDTPVSEVMELGRAHRA
jgi:methionyl-tRNA formyltransferase